MIILSPSSNVDEAVRLIALLVGVDVEHDLIIKFFSCPHE